MNPLLRFRNVTFGYAGHDVIHNASFDLYPGSCTALIGPNGIGKTTLLRIAAGVLPYTSGSVLLHDQPLRKLAIREIARTIALAPQHLEIPFSFTVRQVVEQGRAPYLGLLRGLDRSDRHAVDRALDLTSTSTLEHRIFNELSGGERQRVKIALALAQQPKLLLLDEPTQNLDIARQVELIDLLHLLRSENITTFASIHELQLIEGNFTSMLLLGPDAPLLSGTTEAVLKPDILEKAFNCPPRRHPLLLNPSRTYAKRAG